MHKSIAEPRRDACEQGEWDLDMYPGHYLPFLNRPNKHSASHSGDVSRQGVAQYSGSRAWIAMLGLGWQAYAKLALVAPLSHGSSLASPARLHGRSYASGRSRNIIGKTSPWPPITNCLCCATNTLVCTGRFLAGACSFRFAASLGHVLNVRHGTSGQATSTIDDRYRTTHSQCMSAHVRLACHVSSYFVIVLRFYWSALRCIHGSGRDTLTVSLPALRNPFLLVPYHVTMSQRSHCPCEA
jgi:hypothetical protein